MATISPTTSEPRAKQGEVTWSGMATGDTINPFALKDIRTANGAIQLSGTWGGATVTAQISNDGSTWFTLTDIYGANVSATANAVFEYTTGANYMRFAISGGTSDSVTAVVTL